MAEFSPITPDYLQNLNMYQEIEDALKKRSIAAHSATPNKQSGWQVSGGWRQFQVGDSVQGSYYIYRRWVSMLLGSSLLGRFLRGEVPSSPVDSIETYTFKTLCEDAGLYIDSDTYGFRYARHYDPAEHNWTDINDPMWDLDGNGFAKTSNAATPTQAIIGPWIFDDFHRLLEKLKVVVLSARWTAYMTETDRIETNSKFTSGEAFDSEYPPIAQWGDAKGEIDWSDFSTIHDGPTYGVFGQSTSTRISAGATNRYSTALIPISGMVSISYLESFYETMDADIKLFTRFRTFTLGGGSNHNFRDYFDTGGEAGKMSQVASVTHEGVVFDNIDPEIPQQWEDGSVFGSCGEGNYMVLKDPVGSRASADTPTFPPFIDDAEVNPEAIERISYGSWLQIKDLRFLVEFDFENDFDPPPPE